MLLIIIEKSKLRKGENSQAAESNKIQTGSGWHLHKCPLDSPS